MRGERMVLADGERAPLGSAAVQEAFRGIRVDHRVSVAPREEVGDVRVRVRREERDVAASEVAAAVVERRALVGVEGVPVPRAGSARSRPPPGAPRRRRRAAGARARPRRRPRGSGRFRSRGGCEPPAPRGRRGPAPSRRARGGRDLEDDPGAAPQVEPAGRGARPRGPGGWRTTAMSPRRPPERRAPANWTSWAPAARHAMAATGRAISAAIQSGASPAARSSPARP